MRFSIVDTMLRLDLDAPEVRAAFAIYLESHFALADGEPAQMLLPLKLIGAEVQDDYLFVYQELVGALLPVSLSVRNDALREIFPRQVNLVHVRAPRGTQRLAFADELGWQSINAFGSDLTKSDID